MKTAKKALVLALCALLLVAGSVFGTVAYLTSQDTVTNTFTVGAVALTLDEEDVDHSTPGDNDRDKANRYHLIPGHRYDKDPIVHVDAVSENCWVFVKVENGIAAYESAAITGTEPYSPITDQILANGWTVLNGTTDIYYQAYTKDQADKDLEVFEEFRIADAANDVAGWASISPETTTIKVYAYAVQQDGFKTAEAAWDATFAEKN